MGGKKIRYMRTVCVVLAAGFLTAGCGKEETAAAEKTVEMEKTSAVKTQEVIKAAEAAETTAEAPETSERTETSEPAVSSELFSDLKNTVFTFSSGAGAWRTELQIREDGSFSGRFEDANMGEIGEENPQGTIYESVFTGRLGSPVQLDENSYQAELLEMEYENPLETEEIQNGALYRYTTAYGLEDAENLIFYTPGTPMEKLSEDVKSWLHCGDEVLPFYAVVNEAHSYGFVGENLAVRMKERAAEAENEMAELEKRMQKALTQLDMNDIAGQEYRLWDGVLNELWGVLKQVQSEEEMEVLTLRQRDWIKDKEAAADEAGKEFEGGSMQPMAYSLKAMELTRERVYELMRLLD